MKNRNFKSRFFILLHIALSSFPLLANASILNNFSVEQLTNEAEEVQIGEVVSKWTSPDPDNKMFFTFYKVKVERTIKGKAVKEILLRQPGGTYKDPTTQRVMHQKVFGMEEFQKGERAFFFIKHTKDGAPMMMYQGKRQIVKNKNKGTETAITNRNPDGIEYANTHGNKEASVFAKYDEESVDSMITRIQNAMAKSKK